MDQPAPQATWALPDLSRVAALVEPAGARLAL